MRVLVADGDQESREALESAVRKAGHESIAASDGDAAWELYLERSPHAVVADLLLPGHDGLALCRRIRAQDAAGRTYLLVLVSPTTSEDVLAGLRAGADDYLVKPIDPAALHSRLMVAHRVTTLQAELARYRSALSDRTRTDPLTALSNRLRLSEDLASMHERGQRYSERFAVAVCSIDGYTGYREQQGEAAADRSVGVVASAIAAAVRKSDQLYRFGGAEFAVVLPHQAWAGALAAMDRIRQTVQDLGIEHEANPEGVLTLSVGVSTYSPARPVTSERLIEEADQALSRARSKGANTVVLAEPDQETVKQGW
ncbi:diguanylate cyclase domain-containing protein [Sinomonas mesophila]|uniref:diguanylate cyclase domain-containing protein n=1 Tax=Sinomonas mesophila TaxID=1531955 RepID=UPI0009874E23|nr:diguanylate cyclase [Sinomonas mesophila]